MGDDREGQAGVGKDDLIEKNRQVALVIGEILHMAVGPLRRQPLGAALSAPVEGRDPETGRHEIADRFEVFLDRLVATLQQDDGAANDRGLRPEHRVADLAVAGSVEKANHRIARHRIFRHRVKERGHGAWARRNMQVGIGGGPPPVKEKSRKRWMKSGRSPFPAAEGRRDMSLQPWEDPVSPF
jgi:hypothetical protein